MNPYNRPIAFYISAHGLGHGVRSCDIIRAFKLLYPCWPVHIISKLRAGFFHTRLAPLLGETDRIRHLCKVIDYGKWQLGTRAIG